VSHAAPFTFVALGDTAYNGERDYPVYRALIAAVNEANPAFSIHIGDIWGAGSHNTFIPTDPRALAEAAARMQANAGWLRDSFRIARCGEYSALVIATHAEMFEADSSEDSPFGPILDEIRLGAGRFGKPVLLVHGDYHTFMVDRPFLVKRGEGEPSLFTNVTRLQVYVRLKSARCVSE
jgi:hypothetical protein